MDAEHGRAAGTDTLRKRVTHRGRTARRLGNGSKVGRPPVIISLGFSWLKDKVRQASLTPSPSPSPVAMLRKR